MKTTFQSFAFIVGMGLLLAGCQTTCPPDVFKVSETSLQTRQTQSRQYDTTKEKDMIVASAGALQDMGYTIDESQTALGVIVASKNRDATNGGQVALATTAVIFSALGGHSSDALSRVDKAQKIRASVITRLNETGNKVIVRVTFQRVVWDAAGRLSKVQTLNEPELYTGFFEKLSKAVFLQEQNI